MITHHELGGSEPSSRGSCPGWPSAGRVWDIRDEDGTCWLLLWGQAGAASLSCSARGAGSGEGAGGSQSQLGWAGSWEQRGETTAHLHPERSPSPLQVGLDTASHSPRATPELLLSLQGPGCTNCGCWWHQALLTPEMISAVSCSSTQTSSPAGFTIKHNQICKKAPTSAEK